MTGKKDKQALNNLIIELAKANDWLSRDDLKEITGKPIKTIKGYLKKDIFNFIDTKDFIELVNRNTGRGKTNIEKYKLKSGLDNLLSVFNYFNDKNYQKQLMQTDYYKNIIPEIMQKVKKEFKSIHKDNLTFRIPETKLLYNIGINYSPSVINFILKNNTETFENNIILNKIKPSKLGNLLYMIIYGLVFTDASERIINEEDFAKFQIWEQS